MTNRRDFLKKCACAACFLGMGSMLHIAAGETQKPDSNGQGADEATKNEIFALQWITELLESLDEQQLSDSQLRAIVKKASQAHHDMLNVPEMVKPYVGKPNEFIEFLKGSWGWIITDNISERQLIIDENKPFCVCPLLKYSKKKLFPVLCYCSEGFAEKMFSAVYQRPIAVRIGASVQRGDPSCKYIINY